MKSEITRRDFILAGALTASAIVLPGAFPLEALAKEVAFPDLVIAKGDPGPATVAAIDAIGGMKRFVKKGQKVCIKPNFSFANPPEAATTTHPEVVKAIAEQAKMAGAEQIMIVDNVLHREEACLEKTGIKICELVPDTLVEPLTSSRFFRHVTIPEGKQLKETRILEPVLDADVFIAAPVAKSHSAAGVSLSMKGMMGVIKNRMVFHAVYDLHTAIVDLASRVKPDLVIIDATRLLSDHGPGGPGKVLHPEIVIASTDMVAADAATVSLGEWYGRKVKPRQVKHIAEAAKRGLGRIDWENLRIKRINA